MKKLIYLFLFISLTISCTQVKDIAYIQNTETGIASINQGVFDARIKPKDILSITVVSSEPEASRRYNLLMPQQQGVVGLTSQSTLQTYLVDNDGNINFPVFGTLYVKDKTTKELESQIYDRLTPFFSGEMPVITIRIVNYTVNILGEVNRPGKYETTNERITIFEGLALANDITIYGKRNNVKVLRADPDGNVNIHILNLNDKNVFNSPAFFLEQNDVVYVEPNQSRANSSKYGAAETYRTSTMSVLISLATMAVTIFGITRNN